MYGRGHSPIKSAANVPQIQFCKLHLMKAIWATTERTFKDIYALRPTLKSTTPIIQSLVRILSFVDPAYPTTITSWKDCIAILKSKGNRVMTDLMILPSQIVQQKVDLEYLMQIWNDCFGEKIPNISELAEFQREVWEIVKIQIHLFTYGKEKLESEGDASRMDSEIAESEPELEETQRMKTEPCEDSDINREQFNDTLTSPLPRQLVQRHSKFEDMPLQYSESQHSGVKSSYHSDHPTITESVNKSIREDGTVSISDMLSLAHQTERASDFI